jgi:hypothetical protein
MFQEITDVIFLPLISQIIFHDKRYKEECAIATLLAIL